jgi:hypothetical protein
MLYGIHLSEEFQWKKFEILYTLFPFCKSCYIIKRDNKMLLIVALALLCASAYGAGTTRPSSATLNKLVNEAKIEGNIALMEQERHLASQKCTTPDGFVFIARLPNGLALRSRTFAPSMSFPLDTTFTVLPEYAVQGSIRSLTSQWSISLPKSPMAIPTLPSLVSKGTDVIVPEEHKLYLFERPLFEGTCHQGGERESYNIGSLMLVPKTHSAFVTGYTSPDFGGCDIAISNGTTVGGMQSIVVHVDRVMITSVIDGIRRVFSTGHYHDIDMRDLSIITQIPVNRAYARLCMDHTTTKCWHVIDGYTDTLVHSFTTYSIPFGYELLIRSKKGLIALISVGSVSTSMCSQNEPCIIILRQIETHKPPMICTIYGCYLIYGEYSGFLAIDTINVPAGFVLRITFTVNPFASYAYFEGTHHLSWCILGACTSKLIEVKNI